jgi:uncharacterized membrane protein
MVSAMDEATIQALSNAMLPMLGVYGALFGLLALPMHYQMRLADYFIMDEPGLGALMAVRKSGALMHRNRMAMLRLDLRFWWYYGARLVGFAICYAPMAISLASMEVSAALEIVCYGIYLAVEFFLFAFGRSRVEAAVALAYEALRNPPVEETQKDG